MIKKDADFSIQNNKGDNALHICARQCNSKILGVIVLKMLNDELNGKSIGLSMMTSQAVLKLQNNQNADALTESIHSKSKDCISILVDIGGMKITKAHLAAAKSYINDSSKIYNLLKRRYQAQEGEKEIEKNGKYSRNHLNGLKSTDEVRGKVSDYFLKTKIGSQRDLLSTSDDLNLEEAKVTGKLKNTLEKLTVERDMIRDDRDKLLQLLDQNDD